MNKLRLWRIERGLSQFELAEASGVSRWLIQLIETGIREPNFTQLERLAEVLGTQVISILPGPANRDTSPKAKAFRQPVVTPETTEPR